MNKKHVHQYMAAESLFRFVLSGSRFNILSSDFLMYLCV